MTAVTGNNADGVGVTGTGSTYGVCGTSTGNFAGVVGQNGNASTAPGVYAQSQTSAPGVVAICGLSAAAETLVGSLDEAAANAGTDYPGMAGIFIGPVTITADLQVGANADATTTLKGALKGLTAVFQGGSSPSVKGVDGTGSGLTPQSTCGVWGDSDSGYGVYGTSKSGSGVYGAAGSGGLAGNFDGDVKVHASITALGNITASDVILSGADCAEEFDLRRSQAIEPGSVVVFDDEGALDACEKPYDKTVAGVISGAGTFRPGLVLDRRQSQHLRAPLALIGKVFCKVDASYGAIEIGDLLTTSPTRGHAMKATDPARSFGATIGKALAPLAEGVGMIPILVALR